MPVTARLLCAGQSHPGRVRKNNEDRILVDAERGIFLVVDGLGGHNAGERAAEIAVELVTARLARPTGTVEERIREAITLANNEILRLSREQPNLLGMACVLTLVVLDGSDAVVGHVGDSRLYEFLPGNIRKVTRDQSPVGELEDQRMLSELEAMRHPRRNEVYRDVGSETRSPDDREWVDVLRIPFHSDGALLLCSDGLSDQVQSSDIRTIVERFAGAPEQAVIELVSAANQAGGKDNVSVILIEGSQYKKAVQASGVKPTPAQTRADAAAKARREHDVSGRLLAMLVGFVIALIVVGFVKPGWEITDSGPRLRFGAIRIPKVFTVGSGYEYKTIASAMDRATAGDTVIVKPGIYNEAIRAKEGVRVVSQPIHGAILEGADSLIQSDGVSSGVIDGFRIVGKKTGTAIGVTLRDTAISLSNLHITGTQVAGITIGGATTSSIRACRITEHSGAAVAIGDNSRPEIAYNVLGAGRGVNNPAIEITGSARPNVFDNIIHEGLAEPIWASPLFAANGLIQTNVFVPSAKAPAKRGKVRVLPRD
ncbi:MAG TPA: protein phosphatase 2C domain-containing protein [Bryobacteraceae bacterium]|nr:protein phosphatase 2C domain-containing protein [Bryobacteraceae bacterium]